MANENKPPQISGLVIPPIAFRARRGWQKTDVFVIADGSWATRPERDAASTISQ
jgi:hypothetical protein